MSDIVINSNILEVLGCMQTTPQRSMEEDGVFQSRAEHGDTAE